MVLGIQEGNIRVYIPQFQPWSRRKPHRSDGYSESYSEGPFSVFYFSMCLSMNLSPS